MEIIQLVDKLSKKGVSIKVEGDNLKIAFEGKNIEEALLNEIKENKSKLLQFLKKYDRKPAKEFRNIPKVASQDSYLLSKAQERMWILSQFEEANIAYNLPEIFSIKGQLDIGLMEKSLAQLVTRHEVLRTIFKKDENDLARQYIATDNPYDFKFSDFSKSDAGEKKLRAAIEQEIQTPFDLSVGPLLRLRIYKKNETEFIFAYVMHHIISDGWSLSIFTKELFTIYQAGKNGINNPLEPLPIQYKDYVSWEQEELNPEKLEVHRNYWVNRMEDERAQLNLPLDHPRPKLKTYNGGTVYSAFDASLFENFKSLLQKEGATLYMGLSTLVITLLHRYSLQEDISIGSPSAGRRHPDLEGQIGLFMNTVVQRIQFNRADSFRQLLQNFKKNVVESFEHEHYPFDFLVKDLSAKKDLSRNPLFDVLVVLQNTDVNNSDDEYNPTDFQIQPYNDVNDTTSLVDLAFEFAQSDGQIYFSIEYNTDLFNKETIERMSTHLESLLRASLESIETPIYEINYLQKNETIQLQKMSDGPVVEYPKDKTVLDLFKNQVKNNPKNIAVTYSDKAITFSELDELSNQVAIYLQDNFEIAQNDLVALKMERSEWMSIVILGILKLGCAYLPLGTNYPEDRIAFIQKNSGFKVCFDEQKLNAFLAIQDQFRNKTIELPKVSSEQTAYVIYTSGSTGTPKGVINKHAGLFNRLMWMKDDLKVSSADVFIQKTPYTFDVSVWELILPLITGSKLLYAKPEGHKDPNYLQQLIDEKQVSIIHFVPTMLNPFLFTLKNKSCTSLKHIICSGEALPKNLVIECREKLSEAKIHNYYGPTEAAIDVTAIDLTTTDLDNEGVTIGYPVPNTNIYITNQALQLQPVGIPGELLIGGIQVAEGYVSRPDLNKEKFIDNPFAEGRIYKTGDLAKLLPNGQIDFIGRLDNQVKIRGNRIEIGEIEHVLREYEFIAQSVVIVSEDDTHNKKLLAYNVVTDRYDRDKLYAYLNKKLPDYMIPSVIMEIDEMPLTSSGKINRSALPDPDISKILANKYVAPENEQQQILVDIWQEILGIEKLGIKDNFFQIGGDSIIAIRLTSRINKAFDAHLKVQHLYEQNTIEAYAAIIESEKANSSDRQKLVDEVNTDLQKLKASVYEKSPTLENIEDIFPMNDIQKGMVLLSIINPDEAIYHDQFTYNIPRKIDLELFNKALTMMVDKHATLRTSYDLDSYEKEIQLVHKQIEIKTDVVDLVGLTGKEQEQRISDYIKEERTKPFDSKKAPLWRSSIFNLAEDSNIFLLQFHHAILDGWSVASFNTELFQTYLSLEEDSNFTLLNLQSTYKDAVIEELLEKKNQKSIEFWQNEMADYKRLDIFSQEPCNEHFEQTYPKDFVNKLQDKCKEDGILFSNLIFASFTFALKLLTEESEVVIGKVSNNRPITEDGDKVLGCFLNSLPIRVQFDKYIGLNWKEYFQALNNKLVDLNRNSRLTLLEIFKNADKKGTHLNPFFDVLFSYVDFHVYNELGHELKAESPVVDVASYERTNTLFDLNINNSGDEIRFNYRIFNKLKSEISLEKIHTFVDSLLDKYLNQSNEPVNQNELISTAERKKLLQNFNNTKVNLGKSDSLIALFTEQVQQTPELTAITFDKTNFTYQELDEITNQLANCLKEEYEIKPRDLIGIKLERSEWVIISILGVLKAGAAYVPIDPQYPDLRQESILNDAKIQLLITDTNQMFNTSFFNGKMFAIDVEFEQEKYEKTAVNLIEKSEDLAYVIYTSGSTGKPKGVMIEHQSLVNYLNWAKSYYLKDRKQSNFGLFTSLSFDLTVTSLFLPLISGNQLNITPSSKDITKVLKSYLSSNSNCIKLTPAHISILNEIEIESCEIDLAIVGGDALLPHHVATLKKLNPNIKIYNEYGPTEATVGCIVSEITSIDDPILIGQPIANTAIYILNKNQELLPIGVPGEIYIAGDNLARGYINRDKLTAEKFVKITFEKGRMYKTGDLACWKEDGNIDFMGRVDEQVKINGFRIELGEIENVLQKMADIKQSVVVPNSDQNGNMQLVAFVVPKETYNQDLVIDHFRENLPEYMIPKIIVTLESIPMTPNGKIDRDQLPVPNLSDLLSDNYVEPSNETEKKLELIWQEVLGVKKIGIKDNFFQLGGDSILSVRMVSRINKAFKLNLNVANIFDHLTIEELASLILTSIKQKELQSNKKKLKKIVL